MSHEEFLVQAQFPVSIRRRGERPRAGLSVEPGWTVGRSAEGGACDAKAVGYNPYAPRKPHFAPRATSVISLFMSGGVSHLDTFDPKPALEKYAGQPLSGKGDVVVRQGNPGPLMPSPFQFRKYGQCGMDVSEIFPMLAQHVDEMAFLRSVYGKSNDHVQATYELNTGKIQMGLPSVGSWVTYGLGSENQSLPAFVVIYDHRGGPLGGPSNWSAGYMPAAYQATIFRSAGRPDHRSEAAGRGEPGAAARPAGSAREAQRDGPEELSRQLRTGGTHLVVRAGVSDAELRSRSGGCESRIGGHAQTVRAGREGHGAIWPAMPDGSPPGGARSPVCAALSWRTRATESGHVGCARRCEGESHAARGRGGPSDFRTADRPEGARFAGYHAGALAWRIRAHADFAERRRARSQSRHDDDVDGGRQNQGRPDHRRPATSSATRRSSSPLRSTICTLPCCTCWASTTQS